MLKESKKLEFINITKTFLSGKVIANNKITFSINKGNIHAIVGENGSGKSTLMSILFGLYHQDSGEIKIDSKKVNMFQQGAAKKHKIGMVHQHFHLVDNFSVIDNIILGQESLKLSDSEKNKIKKQINIYTENIYKILKENEDLVPINTKYYKNKLEIEQNENLKDNYKLETNFNKISVKINNLKNRLNKENSKLKPNHKTIEKLDLSINQLSKELKLIIDEKFLPLETKIKKLKQENQKLKENYPKLSSLINEEVKKDSLLNDLKTRNTSKFTFINNKKVIERFNFISKKYGIQLNPFKKVSKLSVGERQKVEILKTLWQEKEVIVFDEPTATLSVSEIESLLKLFLKLKESGVTIIFISHKLKEVKLVSDKISILKKGVLVETINNTSKLTIEQIAKKMIGETIKLEYPKRTIKSNKLLEVKNLSYITRKGFKAVDGVSFDIKENEIFGLAGIEGNGQEEVLNAIAGLKKPTNDSEVVWRDQNITHDKIISKMDYMSHIPIDRFKHGVILNFDLNFNSIITSFESPDFSKLYLKKFKKNLIIDNKSIDDWTEKLIKKLDVQGAHDHKVLIRSLSGGNQQKFVVARELERKHELLIAGHPTRGLDIKAIDNIYKKIIENSVGKATLLYSLELNELMAVCDRIAIMFKGKIIKIVSPHNYTLEQISKLLVGGK